LVTAADPRRETQAAPITTAPIDLRVASVASVFGDMRGSAHGHWLSSRRVIAPPDRLIPA